MEKEIEKEINELNRKIEKLSFIKTMLEFYFVRGWKRV